MSQFYIVKKLMFCNHAVCAWCSCS